MPANEEELAGAFEEGNILHELASPTRILLENGRVVGLECMQERTGRARTTAGDGGRFP